MKVRALCFSLLVAVVLGPAVGVQAQETLSLHSVTFPEKKSVSLEFTLTPRAPRAEVEAKVSFREGQAQIKVDFEDMKPAVLFGGDISCYVVWAVTRGDDAVNLGELWMPKPNGEVEFSHGGKEFALMITAEPYALVDQPSTLVMMTNRAPAPKKAPSEIIQFSGYSDTPVDSQLDSVMHIAWDSDQPLDLMQAQKAYDLAKRRDAEAYFPRMMRRALITLGQARNLQGKDKERYEYSRRSITLSGDAIQMTQRRKEAEELQRQIAARKAEMEALEARARQAEKQSAAAESARLEAERLAAEATEQRLSAQAAAQQAQAEMTRLGVEKAAIETEHAAMAESLAALREESDAVRAESERLKEEKDRLSAEMEALRMEGETLRAEAADLRREAEELSGRLEGALSQVAETRDSARGFIVNLPDILFDLNEAALKPEAKIVIAKLSGILLIMPELNVRVEGHTDSTGSDEYNLTLSEQRAAAVTSFLGQNGIDHARMQGVGYGKNRPVASNDTREGRRKNRRVEIVIARGTIGEGPTTPPE